MFTLTNDETGRTFEFTSEAAYEAASNWYHDHEKETIIKFCADNGLDLLEETDHPYFADGKKLIDDWADAAMELYARVKGA